MLVHRLDRDTSGVLLLAKSPAIARILTSRFRNRDVQKSYWAVVDGEPESHEGQIDLPLAKHKRGGQELMVVDNQHGQNAVTTWRKLASCNGLTWLELKPITGRTHQLRVHCAAMGWPIHQDGKYGNLSGTLKLHARQLMLCHPHDSTDLCFVAEPPQAFAEILKHFGHNNVQTEWTPL